MAVATNDGIKCPQCGTAEQYAGKTNKRKPDNSILRTKQCKVCDCIFSTLEVPLAIVKAGRQVTQTVVTPGGSPPV